jgi:hypothetical protein
MQGPCHHGNAGQNLATIKPQLATGRHRISEILNGT